MPNGGSCVAGAEQIAGLRRDKRGERRSVLHGRGAWAHDRDVTPGLPIILRQCQRGGTADDGLGVIAQPNPPARKPAGTRVIVWLRCQDLPPSTVR